MRTVEGQLIGSKRNNAKNTPRKRIQSLINQQTEQDRIVALRTNVNVHIEDVPIKECSLPVQQDVPYHMPTPKKSSQRPIPITQYEGYDLNTDDGIRQKKYPTQMVYN